jgi:hypothetical protein
LPARIDAALRDRLREQKLVEVETAELLAERAMKWLKTLAFFLGIPILLVIAIFSFFGIKAWSDLLDLQNNLTQPKLRLSQLTEQIGKLESEQKSTAARQGKLEDQIDLSAIRRATRSSIAEWPWLVSLHRSGQPICNGTLIAPRVVLSTAFCATIGQSTSYEVATATDDGDFFRIDMRIPVTKIIVHPAFSEASWKNDIAITADSGQIDT